MTLDNLSRHPLIKEKYAVLAEAANSVGTPQIRNAGTLAGNVSQRPWCWYYRNAFPCFKKRRQAVFQLQRRKTNFTLFSAAAPSFIVHPSDTAVALVALDAKFRIVGAKGERTLPAADFFHLPKWDPAHRKCSGT